uniref:Uncharacterized protein n=1 Tax=Arundo donax TaxID=35708 RepID=A0A0A9FNV2_ARUDO
MISSLVCKTVTQLSIFSCLLTPAFLITKFKL